MHTDKLIDIYKTLFDCFGPQYWWPGETSFEIMVGAVLTQNTSWSNVKKVILTLRSEQYLTFNRLRELPVQELAGWIRSCGYYNLKAKRLKNLLELIRGEFNSSVEDFLDTPLYELRSQLLSVKGIGPETADSIILYAAKQPIFVVDAYTHRILLRHDMITEEAGYNEIQEIFMETLVEDTQIYNEYHALLVRVGKEYCKKRKPDCGHCPLHKFL